MSKTDQDRLEQELTRLRRQLAEFEAERKQCKATERELIAAKTRLEHLIKASPAVIYVAKTSGDYGATFISEHIQQQLGYHPSDFTDDPAFWVKNIYPEDAVRLFDASGTLKVQQKLLDTGHASHEYRFRHKDGGYRWMHDEIRLIRDGNGEPLEIIGYWTDVTAGKLYEEALHRLVEGTARSTGKDFLRALVRHLGKILDIRYALVGELAGAQADSIRTIAVWDGNGFADNFEYPIGDSSLAAPGAQPACCYPQDLKHLFSKLPLPAQIEAGSYVSAPLIGSSGLPLGIMAVMHDQPIGNTELAQSILSLFADRAAAEMERQKAEQDIRNIKDRLLEAQRLAHIGNWNWIIDEDDLWWSDEVYRIFGATPADFDCSYKSFLDFVHPNDQTHVRAAIAKALQEKASYSVEYRIRRPDDQARYCHEHGKIICDSSGKAARMIGTVQDITDLKQAENKTAKLLLQNRNLSQRLFSAQEAERKLLARELHDELGQWLTVIQLNTQLISEFNAGESTDIEDCAHTIAESAHKIHQGIRSMIQSLRPALLDELGLSESLQAMASQWQRHHPDIECRLSLDDGLDVCCEDVAITTYRLIQEALNNVAKHAQATEVTIELHRELLMNSPGGWLIITVTDNGVGLPPDCLSKGMGLAWMRERVLAAGGDFFLDNQEKAGVKLSVCLPLQHDYSI